MLLPSLKQVKFGSIESLGMIYPPILSTLLLSLFASYFELLCSTQQRIDIGDNQTSFLGSWEQFCIPSFLALLIKMEAIVRQLRLPSGGGYVSALPAPQSLSSDSCETDSKPVELALEEAESDQQSGIQKQSSFRTSVLLETSAESFVSASTTKDNASDTNTIDEVAALGLAFGNLDENETASLTSHTRFACEDRENREPNHEETPQAFDRWLNLIQRKATHRDNVDTMQLSSRTGTSQFECENVKPRQNISTPHARRHKKSSSSSSTGFVEAVKSASISLASLSVAPNLRRKPGSSKHFRKARGSNDSDGNNRQSEDSCLAGRGWANDHAVIFRSIQRRRILEEFITTEESYLADVRFLSTVSLSP